MRFLHLWIKGDVAFDLSLSGTRVVLVSPCRGGEVEPRGEWAGSGAVLWPAGLSAAHSQHTLQHFSAQPCSPAAFIAAPCWGWTLGHKPACQQLHLERSQPAQPRVSPATSRACGGRSGALQEPCPLCLPLSPGAALRKHFHLRSPSESICILLYFISVPRKEYVLELPSTII